MNFGLVGKKLEHSYSDIIHSKLSNIDYQLIEIKNENDLLTFLTTKDYIGLNITIPYKQNVVKYLNKIDDIVSYTGVCNTISNVNGVLYGFNTDYYGFDYIIRKNKINLNGLNCMVLGSGASSKTIMQYLLDNGASSVYIVSRTKGLTYDDVNEMAYQIDILVNTTPYNMYPYNELNSLVDITKFINLKVCIDLIYNPYRTKLLLDAKENKIKWINGLDMLVYQAYASEVMFNLPTRSNNYIKNIIRDLAFEKTNIVLIGMPGVGKTTFGNYLANKLNKDFIDTDALVEKEVGMTCNNYIEVKGIEKFREVENNVVSLLKNIKGKIIACGGGTILNQKNKYILQENGIIIYLYKDINKIKLYDNRPLTKTKEDLLKIYKERELVYNNACDYIIKYKNVKQAYKKLFNLLKDI